MFQVHKAELNSSQALVDFLAGASDDFSQVTKDFYIVILSVFGSDDQSNASTHSRFIFSLSLPVPLVGVLYFLLFGSHCSSSLELCLTGWQASA